MPRTRRAARPEPTKENILARALEIQASEGIGFVKANIRARKEFGLVSPNVGKPRLGRKAQAAADAEAAAASA